MSMPGATTPSRSEYGPERWPTRPKTVDGVTCKAFTVEGAGRRRTSSSTTITVSQYDAVTIVLDKNYTIVANPDKAEIK